MQKQLRITIGGHSSAGVKPENQDAFAAHTPEDHQLQLKGIACTLADGVSSSEESQLASQTSVTHFLSDYYSTPDSWTVKTAAARVLTALNGWLYQHGNRGDRARNSLVTTFSALVAKSTTAHLLHVGDSRIYRFRDGVLEQLTRDHSSSYDGRSVLTRALGLETHLDVDYRREPLEEQDLFLLSTDGLHEFLGDRELRRRLKQIGSDLESEARQLVEAALAAGSDDNISCVLLRVDQLPAEALEEAHQKLTELPVPPVLKPGNRIDGYEVLEVLFSGTRSHLYLVRDDENNRLCALKAPSLNFADDPLYLDGFIKEEWVGKRINHPGVMKVCQPSRPKQFLYYLAEYIPGQTLRQWMTDNPCPPLEEVRGLIRQIARAVRAFGRMDMVHQDLKPENILIDRNGRIRIIDFGTVRIAGIDEISSPLDEGGPAGAINYIAPEYLMGERGTPCSDLYSLGVIAYEMLTGQTPYKPRRSSEDRIRGYAELSWIPARRLRPDLPAWIDGTLQKACAADPSRRYPVLSEFLYDLSHPNKAFQQLERSKPLIERNPLLFWKGLCGVLLATQLVQFFS